MKIIRLSTFLDFGGVERRLTNISHVKDENEWIFCAINKGGKAEEVIKKNNKSVFCLNLNYKVPNLKTLLFLYRFFRNEKPDVVHTSGAEANFFGVLAARIAGVPTVIAEEIGVPQQSRIGRIIFNNIYHLAHFVVGNSLNVINYLQTKNKVNPKKLKLVPNPIILPDLEERKEEANSSFTLISVSRLEPIKNIESVLRVIRKFKEMQIILKYIIVGEGSIRSILQELVIDLQIEQQISFLGYQESPYPFLFKADLYVLTSFTEGFSNSLIEAMYSGIPSLSTNVGAAPEIIQDGANGWLIPEDNDEQLFKKLKEIISMSAIERYNIGMNGKETVLTNFTLERHINLLKELYLINK